MGWIIVRQRPGQTRDNFSLNVRLRRHTEQSVAQSSIKWYEVVVPLFPLSMVLFYVLIPPHYLITVSLGMTSNPQSGLPYPLDIDAALAVAYEYRDEFPHLAK